ncbi:hypothetical protein N8156_04295 [Rhodospirillaceae bacterium]|nr:hypothetical protein [Rhodospirillaceae bacterium]
MLDQVDLGATKVGSVVEVSVLGCSIIYGGSNNGLRWVDDS